MGNIIRTYRHITAAALLLTFLLYIGNIYLFTHTHNFNGVKISHSHIYFGTQDNPNHSHSAQQLNLLELLSTFTSEEFSYNNNLTVFISIVGIINQHEISFDIRGYVPYTSLRAPPAIG